MLRKIDCVMIQVENLDVAARYYADVFGLRPPSGRMRTRLDLVFLLTNKQKVDRI